MIQVYELILGFHEKYSLEINQKSNLKFLSPGMIHLICFYGNILGGSLNELISQVYRPLPDSCSQKSDAFTVLVMPSRFEI